MGIMVKGNEMSRNLKEMQRGDIVWNRMFDEKVMFIAGYRNMAWVGDSQSGMADGLCMLSDLEVLDVAVEGCYAHLRGLPIDTKVVIKNGDEVVERAYFSHTSLNGNIAYVFAGGMTSFSAHGLADPLQRYDFLKIEVAK